MYDLFHNYISIAPCAALPYGLKGPSFFVSIFKSAGFRPAAASKVTKCCACAFPPFCLFVRKGLRDRPTSASHDQASKLETEIVDEDIIDVDNKTIEKEEFENNDNLNEGSKSQCLSV